MRKLFLALLLTSGLVFGEELGAEDREIIKELEFFSNLDLMQEDVSLEDLEEMEEEQFELTQRGSLR